MLKCVVQNCENVCYVQCAFRITPQRAEAIKALNIQSLPTGCCGVCGKQYIKARRGGKEITICGCRVE